MRILLALAAARWCVHGLRRMAKALPPDQFTDRYTGAAGCPPGKELTLRECSDAGAALGLELGVVEEDNSWLPTGCYKHTAANITYFNKAAAGEGNKFYAPICRFQPEPLPSDQFTDRYTGAAGCLPGAELTTVWECSDAGAALGLEYVKEEDNPGYPTGCYKSNRYAADTAHFNKAAAAKGNNSFAPICRFQSEPLPQDQLTDRYTGAPGCPPGADLTVWECWDASVTLGVQSGGVVNSTSFPTGCYKGYNKMGASRTYFNMAAAGKGDESSAPICRFQKTEPADPL